MQYTRTSNVTLDVSHTCYCPIQMLSLSGIPLYPFQSVNR